MYKVTTNYISAANESHTLTVNVDDVLCILEKTNPSWWLASNSYGKVGYVPCAYLKLIKTKSNEEDVVLSSINRAIAAIHSSAKGGKLSSEQANLLSKLEAHKQSVCATATPPAIPCRKESTKRRAPPPPARQSRDPDPPLDEPKSTLKSPTATIPSEPPHAPAPSVSVGVGCDIATRRDRDVIAPMTSSSAGQMTVPDDLPAQLLDAVCARCGNLSTNLARELVSTLLTTIGERVNGVKPVMDQIVTSLHVNAKDDSMEELGVVFASLLEIKDDAQQRNWAIANDEGAITSLLDDVISLLTSSDRKNCIRFLSRDDNQPISTLVAYHQMESRTSIRLLLLQVFGVICTLADTFISTLLCTVLPLELIADIRNHLTTDIDDDVERACYAAVLLSVLFSTGEPLPLSLSDVIDVKLIGFLLECVESRDADDERVSDVIVRLLLAINLHYLVPDENVVMEAINTSHQTTALSEKTMLLVNRGDDPTAVERDDDDDVTEEGRADAVLKFFVDVFSRDDTAQLFLYTNDLVVLVDIIARNLADLPAGCKRRTEFLDLLLNLALRSSYRETRHRFSEIAATLGRIASEESPSSGGAAESTDFDKMVVARIFRECGDCFEDNAT